MGLDVVVGSLALSRRELSNEEFQPIFETYVALNEVLAEAGESPHHEPLEIADSDVFEAQMWGYNGLHMVRRLAAHWVIEGALPPPMPCEQVDEVPCLDALYALHVAHIDSGGRTGLMSHFAKPNPIPPFAHLLLHSDCEGFYLPRWMDKVIFENGEHQREGVGGMIGSAPMLWDECQVLASLIDLPEGLSTQDEQLWQFADMPSTEGPLWQQYGVEAYCLTVLKRAIEASARLGAAIEFV